MNFRKFAKNFTIDVMLVSFRNLLAVKYGLKNYWNNKDLRIPSDSVGAKIFWNFSK